MQTQVQIPTLTPVAPGLPEPASATGPRPPPLAEWVIGSFGFLPAARPRHLVFPFSPSAFSFFIPARLHLFLLGSAILAKPQPLAILHAHPAPREPHRCRDPPRGQSAARDRSRPRAAVPELNLPSCVGEGCCRPQPIGGSAGGGRCPAWPLEGAASPVVLDFGRSCPSPILPGPRLPPGPTPAGTCQGPTHLAFPPEPYPARAAVSLSSLWLQRASPPASRASTLQRRELSGQGLARVAEGTGRSCDPGRRAFQPQPDRKPKATLQIAAVCSWCPASLSAFRTFGVFSLFFPPPSHLPGTSRRVHTVRPPHPDPCTAVSSPAGWKTSRPRPRPRRPLCL